MTNFKTADICDDYASEVQVCQLDLRSYGKKRRFFRKN